MAVTCSFWLDFPTLEVIFSCKIYIYRDIGRNWEGEFCMKAAIIDDLALCRDEIRNCLNRYLDEHYTGETPVIEGFGSGEEFLLHFIPGAYDIIFIDQYMEGLSGLGTAERIREKDRLVALIFVTTSLEHAIDSFDVRACGYLVKPYSYEKFEKTMNLAQLGKIRNARFIRLGQDKVLLREILWCDRDNHYIQIHTVKRGVMRFRLSFGELSGLLDPYPQFLACYKGCIVNMERTERIDGLDFVMDTGERVPFSKRDKKKMEKLFDEYMFQREREDEMEL